MNNSKDEKVTQYIEKQKSPQKEILKKLRGIILKTFPKLSEEMWAGVPCYGHSKENSCGLYYIVGLKTHVNLGFLTKGLPNDKLALFTGSGKLMKHIEISSLKDIDEKKIVRLLRLVWRK